MIRAESTMSANYNFVEPSNYNRNPISFLWDAQDMSWVQDEVFLVLYFDILETAEADREYKIQITYDDGNIFDENFASVTVTLDDGSITIAQ